MSAEMAVLTLAYLYCSFAFLALIGILFCGLMSGATMGISLVIHFSSKEMNFNLSLGWK